MIFRSPGLFVAQGAKTRFETVGWLKAGLMQ